MDLAVRQNPPDPGRQALGWKPRNLSSVLQKLTTLLPPPHSLAAARPCLQALCCGVPHLLHAVLKTSSYKCVCAQQRMGGRPGQQGPAPASQLLHTQSAPAHAVSSATSGKGLTLGLSIGWSAGNPVCYMPPGALGFWIAVAEGGGSMAMALSCRV